MANPSDSLNLFDNPTAEDTTQQTANQPASVQQDVLPPVPSDGQESLTDVLPALSAPTGTNPYTADGTQRVAVLGALATHSVGTERFAPMDDLIAQYKDALGRGDEQGLRNSIGAMSKTAQLASMGEAQVQALRSAPAPDVSLKDLLDTQQDMQNRPPDPYALETHGVQQAQDLGATNPTQNVILQDQANTPKPVQGVNVLDTVLNGTRDNAAKAAIIQSEFDKLDKESSDQGYIGKITDLIGAMIPFRSTVSALMGAPDTLSLGEKLTETPGESLRKEIERVWALPLDQFKQEIPKLVNNIKSASTIPGLMTSPNLALAKGALSHYLQNLDPQQKLDFNFWAGLDAASVVPVGAITKIASSPLETLRAVGNRSGAATMAAQKLFGDANDLTKIVQEGEHTVGDVVSGVDAVQQTLPSSVVPSKPVGTKVGADINQVLREMDALSSSVGIKSADRLTPEQKRIAAEQAIKKLESQYGDNIYDIELKNDAFDPNSIIRAYHGTSADFQAFDTSASTLAAKNAEVTQTGATFFSNNPKVADLFASMSGRGRYDNELWKTQHDAMRPQVNKLRKKFGVNTPEDLTNLRNSDPSKYSELRNQEKKLWLDFERRATDQSKTMGNNIRPVNIKPTNPLVIDMKGSKFAAPEFVKAINEGKSAGHDVVIFKDTIDAPTTDPSMMGNVYAVLDNKIVEPGFGELPNGGISQPRFALSEDPDTKIASVSFHMGKAGGKGGFVSEAALNKAMVRRGFNLADIEKVQDTSGQWFGKITQNIREDGVATPSINFQDFGPVGPIGAMVRSPDHFLPDLWNQMRLQQTLQKTRIQNHIIKPLARLIGKTTDKKGLTTVLQMSEGQQKWFNGDELNEAWERATGKNLTDKDAQAYYAAKTLNDFDWSVRNREVYIENARKGIESGSIVDPRGSFDTGRRNIRVLENPDFDKLRVLDIEDYGHYAGGTNTARLKAKMDSGKYYTVELHGDPYNYGDEPVKYVLAPKNQVARGPLDRVQLGYVPGGHRENTSRYFVKQVKTGKFRDGSTYMLNPKTIIASRTRKEAEDWIDGMEHARQTWIDDTASEADKIRAIEESPVESIEQWQKMLDSGEISVDTPFELTFDRGQPQSILDQRFSDATNWMDPDLSPMQQYYLGKGRMYYSAKGERLKDPNGNLAEILDPLTTLRRSLGNTLSTRAMSDYNKSVIDEWVRVATPYIDRRSIGVGATNQDIFFNARLSDDLRLGVNGNEDFAKLEAARLVHQRLLGKQTWDQKQGEYLARQFADWADDYGSVGRWAAGKALDINAANPVSAVRAFVYDSILGLFNPRQLFVQTQTAWAAMTVHPVWGVQAAASTPAVLWMMTRRLNWLKSEATLDHVASAIQHASGMAPAEFKSMIKELRANSWLEVGGEQTVLDRYANGIGGGMFSQGLDRVRLAGRYPLYLAERINRSVAYQLAWKDIRKEFADLPIESDMFKRRVLQKANDYAMNMTTASQAGWQKGLLSIPTQFMPYQVRFVENLFNKRFTAAQRSRLLLGQFLSYGATGLGLGSLADWATEQYTKSTGTQPDPGWYRAYTKGFWDSAAYLVSGGRIDTDFARSAAPINAWTQLFESITDGRMNSFMSQLGGVSADFTGTTYERLGRALMYLKSEQSLPSPTAFALAANEVFKTISTYRYATKAYSIWKYSQLNDPKTGQPIMPVDQLNAYASLLGVQLRGETERWDMMNMMSSRADMAQEIGGQIAKTRIQAMQALEGGDQTKFEHFMNVASGMAGLYHDDPLFEQMVLQEAKKSLARSTTFQWNQMVQRMMEQVGTPPPGGIETYPGQLEGKPVNSKPDEGSNQ